MVTLRWVTSNTEGFRTNNCVISVSLALYVHKYMLCKSKIERNKKEKLIVSYIKASRYKPQVNTDMHIYRAFLFHFGGWKNKIRIK